MMSVTFSGQVPGIEAMNAIQMQGCLFTSDIEMCVNEQNTTNLRHLLPIINRL